MARRRAKMYKQTTIAKYEELGTGGSWNNIALLRKQEAAFTSAYIDKIRISYILEGDTGFTDADKAGVLWVVSNKETLSGTDASNSGYLISSSAGRLQNGVVTLPVGRRVTDNDFDSNSGHNALMIHARTTDTGEENPALTMVIEVWGRWHDLVAQTS